METTRRAMDAPELALLQRAYQLLGALRQDPAVGTIRMAQEASTVQLWFEAPAGQVWSLRLEPHAR